MVDKKQLEEISNQYLEEDIISALAEIRNLDLREACDIYYSSKLSEQVEEGKYGINNLDPKYLAEDLIENEPELFEIKGTNLFS